MDKNQLPPEPSTVRPMRSAAHEGISLSRKPNYGRRLFIVSCIAYLFPLIAIVLPAFLLLTVFTAGLDGLIYVLRDGTIPIFLAYIVVSELILLIMSIYYLFRGRLTGKARMMAIISLVMYSLMTTVLLVLSEPWMVEK